MEITRPGAQFHAPGRRRRENVPFIRLSLPRHGCRGGKGAANQTFTGIALGLTFATFSKATFSTPS
jgi:hypothetical protein